MSRLRIESLIAPCLLAFSLTPPLHANHDRPGSLLLFHEYDHRPGEQTLLTVTNASFTESCIVDITYISEACEIFVRQRNLTAGDTLSLLTGFDNPFQGRGFAYVVARNPMTGQVATFNELIGSAIHMSSVRSFDYAYNAMSYQGLTAPGSPTDVDADGVRDFDGTEYAMAPDQLLFPRFIGQSAIYDDELVLVGLTGSEFTTTVNFLAWNDNEEVFSAQYQFGCWAKVRLVDVSPVFSQAFLLATNHDPFEIDGLTSVESGWFGLDGAVAQSSATTVTDPAFAALLIETGRGGSLNPFSFNSARTESAVTPFYRGFQDNGDLLPFTAVGDP